ncbi:MAG: phosphate acyltransferase [Acidimicrobiales bacterium]
MSDLLRAWYERASASRRRIILADAGDDRAVQAADRLARDGLVDPVVIGRDVATLAEVGHAAADELVAELAAVVDGPWAGRPLDVDDPLIIAAALVKTGWAAGCVAGASRPTPDVIRAGIRVLGTTPGVDVVSSSFFFVLPDGRAMAYGDCGVVPDPDTDQLASIAVSTATTYRQLAADEPAVAMLSFSTKGSAAHPRVDRMGEATALIRQRRPDLLVDGELQFDAAWVPEVAEAKAPDSPVAGRANVFIFPDLDSGNIAYKITERLGGAQAFGPLLQGLDGVMHDLSRGCSVDDIVNVAVIASLQSGVPES